MKGDLPEEKSSISLFTATCIVVANMVGVGVFTSLGFQAKAMPSASAILFLWILGGVVALCGALVYGELASVLPRSGGEYHLLSAIYHPAAGFLAGWLSITVGFAAPVALAAKAFADYFHGAFGVAHPQILSVGVIVAVTLVHLLGTKVGGVFQNTVTTLKIGLILSLIFAGVSVSHPQPVSFLPRRADWSIIGSSAFAGSLVYVMYAYSGWNATVYIVSELKNPRRTLPLSVALGTLLVLVLYVSVNAVFLHVAPLSELSRSGDKVSFVAATYIFGERGGRVIAGFICAGLISTVSAMTWVGPRVSAAMGEDWRPLRFLARRSSTGVPFVAIITQSLIASVLVAGSFESVTKYTGFSLALSSFLTVAGIFVLRKRFPALPRPIRAVGYPFTPIIFLAVTAWMLWVIFRESPFESLLGLGTIAIGLCVYAVSPKRERQDFEKASNLASSSALPAESPPLGE